MVNIENEPEWFRKWILLREWRNEIGDCSQMTNATIVHKSQIQV